MIIAVDFDGVIHNHNNPVIGRKMGEPMEGAKEAIEKLIQTNEIIIFSVWAKDSGIKTIADWMQYYQIPYSQITNIKPQADVYLDDKAIRFINWEQALKDINYGQTNRQSS